MDTSMINKIQKAKELAEQPEKITFHTLDIKFDGDNDSYNLSLSAEGWSCSCPGFQKYNICPHIMTVEKLFKPMLKREPMPYAPGQNIVSDVKKSKRYAEEVHRITITSFTATIEGENKDHHVSYDNGKWNSDSSYFHTHGVDSYTMAFERILKGMVETAKVEAPEVE